MQYFNIIFPQILHVGGKGQLFLQQSGDGGMLLFLVSALSTLVPSSSIILSFSPLLAIPSFFSPYLGEDTMWPTMTDKKPELKEKSAEIGIIRHTSAQIGIIRHTSAVNLKHS